MKPVIGITPCSRVDDYVESVRRAGGEPRVLRNSDDPAKVIAEVDGLVLTGGLDVDPSLYGEEPHEMTETAPERDRFEIPLSKAAVAADVPVLAICRGVQVLNVAMGGSLYQDIPSQIKTHLIHDSSFTRQDWTYMAHDLNLAPGSKLAQCFGTTSFPTNSLHHQSLKAIAPGLRPVGWAPDGVVEAIEGNNGHFLIGVQCHPEALQGAADPRWQALFTQFVESCIVSVI